MANNKKINLISILLVMTAIVMIAIGIAMKIPAPAITGAGFLLIVWAFQWFNTRVYVALIDGLCLPPENQILRKIRPNWLKLQIKSVRLSCF